MRLSDKTTGSGSKRRPFHLKEIAKAIERNFGLKLSLGTVCYWTNPEYRRDRIRYKRMLRSQYTKQDREELAAVRRAKANVKFRVGTPEHMEHMRQAREKWSAMPPDERRRE